MFSFVEDVAVPHDAGEDVAVGKKGSLGDSDAVAGHLTVLSPFVKSAHEGVYLKSKAPASWILVIESEEIDVLLFPYVLPFGEWLVEYVEFWKVLPDDFEYG